MNCKYTTNFETTKKNREILLLVLKYNEFAPVKGKKELIFGSSYHCYRDVVIFSANTLEVVGYYLRGLHEHSSSNNTAKVLANYLESNHEGMKTKLNFRQPIYIRKLPRRNSTKSS
jgi:hypothetical protein